MNAANLAELQTAVESLIRDERDWQARLNQALESQYVTFCEIFHTQTAELLAVIGGAS